MFQEKGITYDFNGNMLGLQRTNSTGAVSDDFSKYQYTVNTNKLTSVGNTAGTSTYGTYAYDEIGRLKSQANTLGTTYLKYDVTGKITGIYTDAAMTLVKESYAYDESGNRIKTTNTTGTTYYIYDATGKVLGIYTGSMPVLSEVPVYASNRLGTYYVAANNYVYEIKDNVGSVRVAINSTKISGQADVYTYNDYFPFGSIAQSGGIGYRYDYQGAYSEKDPVTGYNNFQFRMYDGKIGRWLSKDSKHQFSSLYIGMGNNPANAVDPDGQLIIFVNGFYLPFGSSGASYWNFANKIEDALGDHNALFADGNSGLIPFGRYVDGYMWAKQNIDVIYAEYVKTGTLEIVSHSMGDAYSLGIKDYVETYGMNVNLHVAIAPFQSKSLNWGVTKTFLFQNLHDNVAGTDLEKGTNILQKIGNGNHFLNTFQWILPILANAPGLPTGYVTVGQGHVGLPTTAELNSAGRTPIDDPGDDPDVQ